MGQKGTRDANLLYGHEATTSGQILARELENSGSHWLLLEKDAVLLETEMSEESSGFFHQCYGLKCDPSRFTN